MPQLHLSNNEIYAALIITAIVFAVMTFVGLMMAQHAQAWTSRINRWLYGEMKAKPRGKK